MAALSSTFGMNAKGSDPLKDLEVDIDPAANDPTYVRPQIDLMQAAVRQVAQPQQDSANKPSSEVAKAMQQREQLTSKAPGGMGGALSNGSSAKAGAERQATAQDKLSNLADKVAKLDNQIAGGGSAKSSLGNKFAGAAMGQVVGMGVGAAVSAVSPVLGTVVAVGSTVFTAHQMAEQTFRGGGSGPSSFKSAADSNSVGYGSAASAQPATMSVAAAAFQNMMDIPGQRRIGSADIDIVRQGLGDITKITKAPPLDRSPAFTVIAGAFTNGGKIREAENDPTYDKDADLLKPMKPNLGVMVPSKPLMA